MTRASVAGPINGTMLDADVRPLFNHLVGAVQRSLRMCDGVALPFAARPEEMLVAALAREQGEVPVHLLHVRARGAAPVLVRNAARHLGLSLIERVHAPSEVDLSADPFQTLAEEARLVAPRLLLMQGSRSVFGETGPVPRPDEAQEKAAAALRLQLRFPYLDKGLVPFLRSHPGLGWTGLASQLGLPVADPSDTVHADADLAK